MSKRAGTFVTVRDLLDEVGTDAARFFLIQRSSDVMMNFDLDLARRTSDENPVYYVQYAHARTASIFREAPTKLGGGVSYADGDVRLLTEPSELSLIRKLLLFPRSSSRRRWPWRRISSRSTCRSWRARSARSIGTARCCRRATRTWR